MALKKHMPEIKFILILKAAEEQKKRFYIAPNLPGDTTTYKNRHFIQKLSTIYLTNCIKLK